MKKASARKAPAKRKPAPVRPPAASASQPAAPAFPTERPRRHSGSLSGDLQGLSNRGYANSESVDELLEEGNSFEAGAVRGVEEAGNTEGREVHTHEVPTDDVPDEYLDND